MIGRLPAPGDNVAIATGRLEAGTEVERDGSRFTIEHTIHVAEGHQGAGVGRALLLALIDHGRRAGKRVMVAAIDASNTGSIAFRARFGFVEVARMPGVGEKWGRRLDLVLMQLDLTCDRHG